MPPTSFETESEWQLLCAASTSKRGTANDRLSALLESSPKWGRLFELAENHGVQPLLYQALEPFRASSAAEHFDLLASKIRANVHKAMMLSRELIHILDALSETGVEALPYKGLALAESLYGDIALRQAGDIDLLIKTEDLSRARGALRTLNFTPHLQLTERQERAYLRSGYELTFDSPAGRNLLELQWAAQPRFYAVDWSIGEVFQRAMAVTVAGRAMKTPCFEDLFIILSLHAAKHLWGKLIWICDVARLMELPTLNWPQIALRAKSLRIRRIVACNLSLANRLFGFDIPPAAKECLLEDEMTIAFSEQIARSISSGKVNDVESIAYFRKMLQLREHWIDRTRFLARLTFTPGPSEWAAVRLPDSLFPLYRLVRISRLAARLVRA